MKKMVLLISLVVNGSLIQAQRFFYVEPGNRAERELKEDLLKASQLVVRSPLMSDFIIKTEIGFRTESKTTTLKIILQDSVSLKTIFQSNEEYAFGAMKLNAQIVLDLAMKTLIEKSIDQIIFCAKNDHRDGLMKWVEIKKDKT